SPATHVMLKYSVIAPEFSPGAIRRTARPPAGPDPETADRYQGYPHRHHHPAVPGIYGQGPRNGYRPGGRVRVHGGDPDPHQEQDAAAARPGAGDGRRRIGRPATGTGRPAPGARALQERRRDAAAETHDRGERLEQS